MSNPLTAFHDDDGEWSMTRVVAWMFALTICTALLLYAWKGKQIEWPFAALGGAALFAVPIQALCRYIQEWFSSSPGQKMMAALMAKVVPMISGSTVSTTTVHAESTTQQGDKG